MSTTEEDFQKPFQRVFRVFFQGFSESYIFDVGQDSFLVERTRTSVHEDFDFSFSFFVAQVRETVSLRVGKREGIAMFGRIAMLNCLLVNYTLGTSI